MGRDTMRAGREGTHGSLFLNPGGQLVGESTLRGEPLRLAGGWYFEGPSLLLKFDSIAKAVPAALQRDGTLEFRYPLLEYTKEWAYETAMKSDLRNLISSEESFFSDSAKYTTSLIALNFKPSTGVNAPKIEVVRGGFSAVVTHRSVPGARCAVAVFATNPVQSAVSDGVPVCEMPQPKDTSFLSYTWRKVPSG